jgi:hypothetical protein
MRLSAGWPILYLELKCAIYQYTVRFILYVIFKCKRNHIDVEVDSTFLTLLCDNEMTRPTDMQWGYKAIVVTCYHLHRPGTDTKDVPRTKFIRRNSQTLLFSILCSKIYLSNSWRTKAISNLNANKECTTHFSPSVTFYEKVLDIDIFMY